MNRCAACLTGKMRVPDRQKQDEGFTLVELLVVVLIIAILAAVAIPVYLGQQSKAHDAAVKSALQTVQVALTKEASENGGVLTDEIWNHAISASGYTPTNYTDSTAGTASVALKSGEIAIGQWDGATVGCFVIKTGTGNCHLNGERMWQIDPTTGKISQFN